MIPFILTSFFYFNILNFLLISEIGRTTQWQVAEEDDSLEEVEAEQEVEMTEEEEAASQQVHQLHMLFPMELAILLVLVSFIISLICCFFQAILIF